MVVGVSPLVEAPAESCSSDQVEGLKNKKVGHTYLHRDLSFHAQHRSFRLRMSRFDPLLLLVQTPGRLKRKR